MYNQNRNLKKKINVGYGKGGQKMTVNIINYTYYMCVKANLSLDTIMIVAIW